MTRPEEQLLARYLEGELSPEEETALLEILRQDPQTADALEELLRLEERLREAMVPEAGADALARAVAERLDKSGGTDFFVRAVVDRLLSERAPAGGKKRRLRRLLRMRNPSRSAFRVAPLAAASALFAILVLAMVGHKPIDRSIATVPEKEEPAEAPLPDISPAPRPTPPPEQPRPSEENVPVPAPEGPPRPPPPPKAPDVPAPPPPAREEPPAPKTTVPAPTLTAVARIEALEGNVLLEGQKARTGDVLPAGWRLKTGNASSSATVVLADGTRVKLAGATGVSEDLKGPPGKRLQVAGGAVTADVAKQSEGQRLVFATAHAEAEVLGTRLRLDVTDASSLLEVHQGRVRFFRKDDRRSVEVGPGQFAMVSRGVPFEAGPVAPLNDVVLLPRQGTVVSPEKHRVTDWRLVSDGRAATGWAFDAPQEWNGLDGKGPTLFKMKELDYVEFTFRADPDKVYHLWLRGCAMAGAGTQKDKEWFRFDNLAVELLDADVTAKQTPMTYDGGRAFIFNGFGQREGYWWISGNADPVPPGVNGPPGDDPPLTVRFRRPGLQVLRVYPLETPLRFDAVWLSATQSTRPAPRQSLPRK